VIDDAPPIYPLSRRARMVVLGLVVALVIGPVGVYWRCHYGIWPGARYPSAVHYCNRTYTRDSDAGSRSAAQVLAHDYRPAQFSDAPLLEVSEFDAPLAHSYPLFRNTPANVRVGDSMTCTMNVYLRTGPDRYLTYALAGSPG
jgi:hypothetical protein